MDISLALRSEFIGKLNLVASLKDLEALRIEFLGKEGLIAEQMKKIGALSPEERKSFGATINEVRNFITDEIAGLKAKLDQEALKQQLAKESIDVTLPARAYEIGKMHPISKVMEEIKEIFSLLGFGFNDGPDIEDDWHNFTALNIPETHPARQMHDTFYLREDNLLLRTHTSTVQIRTMQNSKPPFKFITYGRTYRSDYDATHTPMFNQLEGVYIDKGIHMGHLKGCLEQFLKQFFGLDNVTMRFRPSYFPFTEPSIEVDIKCDRSNKAEIKIGQGNDWLEILGCGMVHPNVLKNVGVDPKEYQGFAFGVGIERLAMLKYNIPDLRSFFEGDVRWHKHYGM